MTVTTRPSLTWSLPALVAPVEGLRLDAVDTGPMTADWAWGDSTGSGVRVCIVDSGIEPNHPLVGDVVSSQAVVTNAGELTVTPCEPGDVYGHGTACASIVRRIAPQCELHSVRILGDTGNGSGDALVAGLRWAVEQRFDLVNLSLSTTRPQFDAVLRKLTDEAYFNRVVTVASAHNLPVESFPWRYSSVISVGSHRETDPTVLLYNPTPPVEFFARGQAVPVAGLGGGRTLNTGNSFATPHVTGRCALILSKHPGLTPFHLKTVLRLTATNHTEARDDH